MTETREPVIRVRCVELVSGSLSLTIIESVGGTRETPGSGPIPPEEQSERAVRLAPGDYLSTREAATYIGYAPATLAKWRNQGGGPRFSEPRPHTIRYRRRDLDKWMTDRQFSNTSQAREADTSKGGR